METLNPDMSCGSGRGRAYAKPVLGEGTESEVWKGSFRDLKASPSFKGRLRLALSRPPEGSEGSLQS